jgi:DNA-binding HxlR family transcriptional regulator
MLNAGVDKVHRDMIVGHSLKGMDAYYLVPTEDSLREAMNKYTQWLDKQLDAAQESVDQNVDQN